MNDLICLICSDSRPNFTARCNHNFHLSCLESKLTFLPISMKRKYLFCPLCNKSISDNLYFERLLCEKSSLTVD